MMQNSQAQLLVAQASLAESQEYIASLKSQVASMAAELKVAREEAASTRQDFNDALQRAHLSESHAAQMQQITEHLQSSVSQQVRVAQLCLGYGRSRDAR